MNVLDLFSGIGGFSLGLERAGMRTVAFCEIDQFCRRVLAKHWPDVPVFRDVRTLAVDEGWLISDANERCEPAQEELRAGWQRIRADSIDVICGGFPCQDISVAGKGAGVGGEHSGLWSEYARIISEVRPRYVIVENVAALLGRGLERVLGDLAALGFDAEWHCIPASAVGAPHRRDRVWIVGFPNCAGRSSGQSSGATLGYGPSAFSASGDAATVAYAAGSGLERWGQPEGAWTTLSEPCCGGSHMAITEGSECGAWWARRPFGLGAWIREFTLSNADSEQAEWSAEPRRERDHWLVEPDVGRVAHGIPARVHRLRALGNAVVPQIPELIGRAIMSSEPRP